MPSLKRKISFVYSALNVVNKVKNITNKYTNQKIIFSNKTVIGALAKYISTSNEKFQPMNANFGILPELEGKKIKDKKERYMKLVKRSLENF